MTSIVPLNLPKTNLSLSRSGKNIYVNCLVRRKKIILTPEEWVRQHFVAYFIDKLKYPKGLLTIEKKIQYGGLEKDGTSQFLSGIKAVFCYLSVKLLPYPLTKLFLNSL